MFTKNYHIMRLMDLGANTDLFSQSKLLGKYNFIIRKTDGNEITSLSRSKGWCDAFEPFKYWQPSAQNHCFLLVGTNGSSEDPSDYNISTFSTTEYTTGRNIDSGGTYTVAPDGNSVTNTIYSSYLNTSGTTQAIREIGAAISCREVGDILLYRKVISSPILVPPGGYFKISFSYKVPLPEGLKLNLNN